MWAAILCPNELMINISRHRQAGRLTSRPMEKKGHCVKRRLRGVAEEQRDESHSRLLRKHRTAELTSYFQSFHQESSTRRSKMVIVAAKDILSELSIF